MYPLTDHLARYNFASKYTNNRNVLEVGCGTGYGTGLIAKNSTFVVGVDTSVPAISYAKREYSGENCEFLVEDGTSLAFATEVFDVLLSFEMIEHLSDPNHYLTEIHRVLKKGGVLIISTPNKLFTSPGRRTPIWKYHLREFYYEEFKQILKQLFPDVIVLGQRIENPRNLAWDQRVKMLHRVARLIPSSLIRSLPLSMIYRIMGDVPEPKLEEITISEKNASTARTFIGICFKAEPH